MNGAIGDTKKVQDMGYLQATEMRTVSETV
jgi:hypothetical protein